MSTEYEQDLQEFIDLRARIKELESALQEIHNEATRSRDWGVVKRVARGVLYPHLSEYLKEKKNEEDSRSNGDSVTGSD